MEGADDLHCILTLFKQLTPCLPPFINRFAPFGYHAYDASLGRCLIEVVRLYHGGNTHGMECQESPPARRDESHGQWEASVQESV